MLVATHDMEVAEVGIGSVGVDHLHAGVVESVLENVAVDAGVLNPAAGEVESVVAIAAREEYRKVEALVGERVADTIGELGLRVADKGAVLIIDLAVAVDVGKAEVAYESAVLANGVTLGQGDLLDFAVLVGVVEVLRLVETADDLVAPELPDRLTLDGAGDVYFGEPT